MERIVFLHGFFASGSCAMAVALREAFDGKAVVLTPDLPRAEVGPENYRQGAARLADWQ